MSDAFTVFVRHEEKVLLMQRADEVADLPGAWDGVYGYGDHNNLDTVISRIVESTEFLLTSYNTLGLENLEELQWGIHF